MCSCQVGYIGIPPNCRPECVVSTECPQDLACINQHCTDPCPGTCGYLAKCHTINHKPVCSCPPGYVGDPFYKCILEESKKVENFWIIILRFIRLENSNVCFRRTCYTASRTAESLRTVSMRSKFVLPSDWKRAGLFMSSQFCRTSTELPS